MPRYFLLLALTTRSSADTIDPTFGELVISAEDLRVCTVIERGPAMSCVNEESSFQYKARLKDPDGNVITSFSAIELTIYDPETDEIVNSREAVNVNGANGGDVDDEGWFTWDSEPDDAVILDDTKRKENRVLQFRFAWPGGGQHYHEFEFQVKNLALVGEAS
jgi:hypothetical protein